MLDFSSSRKPEVEADTMWTTCLQFGYSGSAPSPPLFRVPWHFKIKRYL